MHTISPEAYPRRILLAVAAYSPQIVTETLYALTQHHQPAYMPTELHIITTGQGYKDVARLFGAEGWLQRLCDDYELPYPQCGEAYLHLIQDSAGQVLDDVRTALENTQAADFITQVVQRLTSDAQSSLVVSLSGGRRTMTFYVGYALSLFGRPQDRLNHVVVDSEYYFNLEFFYPPPCPVWVTRADGSGFDASTVTVTLGDIPFVRLREGLPLDLLQGQSRFSEAVQAIQSHLAPIKVIVQHNPPQLRCADQVISLPPVLLAFYVWFLRRCQQHAAPIHWTDDETPCLARQYLDTYSALYGRTGTFDNVAKALSDGLTKNWFDERKSQLHKHLKQHLGHRSTPYLLHAHGKRPQTRFSLTLPVDAIHFR